MNEHWMVKITIAFVTKSCISVLVPDDEVEMSMVNVINSVSAASPNEFVRIYSSQGIPVAFFKREFFLAVYQGPHVEMDELPDEGNDFTDGDEWKLRQ